MEAAAGVRGDDIGISPPIPHDRFPPIIDGEEPRYPHVNGQDIAFVICTKETWDSAHECRGEHSTGDLFWITLPVESISVFVHFRIRCEFRLCYNEGFELFLITHTVHR